MNDAPRSSGDIVTFRLELDVPSGGWEGQPGCWDEIESLAAAGRFDEVLTGLRGDGSGPEIWLVLYEDGDETAGILAALGLARACALREAAALVVDGDEADGPLTQAVGRTGHTGWIDMMRFGASPSVASRELPFAGRRGRVMGHGSFAPLDATADERMELVARLRRLADQVIIVAPSDVGGRHWVPLARRCLLCWDEARHAAGDLTKRLAQLAEAGVNINGVLAYGPAPDRAAPGQPDVATATGDDDRDAIAATADDDQGGIAMGGAADVSGPVAALADVGEQEWARRKRTSGIFWLSAAISVVLIAVVGYYYMTYVRVPATGNFGPAADAGSAPDGPATGDGWILATGNDTLGGSLDADQATPQQPDALVDPPVRIAPADDPDSVSGTEIAAGPDTAGATGSRVATQSDAAAEVPAEAEPEPATFDPEPFHRPVGASGWALHVFSFADSTQAQVQMARLARRGLTAATVAVDIENKGRYHRIYLGDFATRAEARAAIPGLLRYLREDWARPVAF